MKAHFGVLTYKGTGHLNPLIALSRQLVSRGHRVTFFQAPELAQKILQHGLEFAAIDIPSQSKPRATSRIAAIRHGVNCIAEEMELLLQRLPAAIQASGAEALLISEIALSGPTLAEALRLPYFIISTSIPHNFGWTAPSSISSPGSWLDRLQKYVLEVSVLRMKGPVRRQLDQYRSRIGLASIRKIHKTFPPLAHITQVPQCFDLPRPALPANFFYTAPFVDESTRRSIPFPWDCLDGRSIVYASLGTTRKNDPALFHHIAEACCDLNVQLIITLGGRRDPALFAGLPGDPVVVEDAPQLELLKRAEIVITHAGPNTALETLMQGKPMLALPMLLDQPAVATRLARLRAAEVLSLSNRSSQQIRAALVSLLTDSGYRDSAKKIQTQILSLDGPKRAADIIEATLGGHLDVRQTER